MTTKCYICHYTEVEKKKGEWRSACERCEELLKAPPCRSCGQPVRSAKKNEPNPYHEECRRCSSCHQKVSRTGMKHVAGKLLCASCEDLFGEFFIPGKRPGMEYMQEAFKAWDADASGNIERAELRRVLGAIMPNFSDRDLNELMRVIDENGNGVVEYEEFCSWLTKETPLEFSDSTFSAYVAQLMKEAGQAREKALLKVDEVQVRTDGTYFKLVSGTVRLESTAFRNESLSLTALDPEEFISKVECIEDGLVICFNTGRTVTLEGKGPLFGPFSAPAGFHIEGLRVKPLDAPDASGARDFVSGVDLAPLPSAAVYDAPTALMHCAEQEFLRSLREILAKAGVDVNAFGAGGATALMLAASRGSTGAMRLLISSKANPNLADADGWTALTYASRCGSREAVEALVEKGAKEDAGDGGKALTQALLNSNNSAARALLRAGFGPAPAGTFALEAASAKQEDCKLTSPTISPNGGAFAQPKKVSIMVGDQDAGSAAAGLRVLYTLDGRDPFLAGQRYIGPITITGSSTQLRAVAVQGSGRSMAVEATFVICHCALPDEIVSGVIRACLFPGGALLLKRHACAALELPEDRLNVSTEEAGDSEGRWIEAKLVDTKPRHLLRFDMAFATVRAADKRKKWLTNITNDIQKAIGEEPEDCKVLAGSIILEFEMARVKAEELAAQLTDPHSYLLSKARCKRAFQSANLQVVESLGQRLSEVSFRDEMEEALKSKALRPKVLSIGNGDEGFVACKVDGDDKKVARQLKKKMEAVIKKKLDDVEFTEVKDYSEELDLSFNVDIMEKGQGKAIVEALQDTATTQKIADMMAIMEGIDTEVSMATAASSRKLSNLEFLMKWEPADKVSETDADPLKAGLDCMCLAFAEEHLAKVINFSSIYREEESSETMTKDQERMKTLSKSITRALTMGEEPADSVMAPQEAKLIVDLSALPQEVTDLYFVMSSFEGDDLSGFADKTFAMKDVVRDYELTSSTFDAGESKAAIVANLSRHGSGWVLHAMGTPVAEGTVHNLDPILRILYDLQGHHLNWERRRDLVQLRVLHKCGRMDRSSDADFAMLMQLIMDLPVAVFQLLVKML